MVVSEYFAYNFKVPLENIGVLSGPCHAEEIALERMSFLTSACKDIQKQLFWQMPYDRVFCTLLCLKM